jgi:carbamoylphosphate synthase large subunit
MIDDLKDRSAVKPVVLLIATSQWFPIARVALALGDAGCAVEAVCTARNPIYAVTAVRRVHKYRGLLPLASLSKAIRASRPDLIIPGDDLSARHLYQLYRHAKEQGAAGADICALIERSIGPSSSFPIVYERAAFMRTAHEEGIRTPQTFEVRDPEELRKAGAQLGFPLVMKADGTSGGFGVRVVRSPEEAEQAFYSLQSPPVLMRAIKRAVIDRDRTLVWPAIRRRQLQVSAQTFVDGCEATSAVACWQGTVLAALHFEVIKKRYASGPATVMRMVDHPEMMSAVSKMVRRLNLSGLHGFDFMLEAQTKNAYLIEINPRTTQVVHLALGPGRDLPAALFAVLSGTPPKQQALSVTDKDTIALFPQEWMRDPASPLLQTAYHDVPWHEPKLLELCIERARKEHRSNNDARQPAGWPVANASLPAIAPRVRPAASLTKSSEGRYE